jgi:hypothetical protein
LKSLGSFLIKFEARKFHERENIKTKRRKKLKQKQRAKFLILE